MLNYQRVNPHWDGIFLPPLATSQGAPLGPLGFRAQLYGVHWSCQGCRAPWGPAVSSQFGRFLNDYTYLSYYYIYLYTYIYIYIYTTHPYPYNIYIYVYHIYIYMYHMYICIIYINIYIYWYVYVSYICIMYVSYIYIYVCIIYIYIYVSYIYIYVSYICIIYIYIHTSMEYSEKTWKNSLVTVKQTSTVLAPKATSARFSCPLKGGQCRKMPTLVAWSLA